MGELWFVGLGLGDEQDLGRRARELLRGADRVFTEEYTAVWASGALDRLAAEIGRPIDRLSREEVEGERRILEAIPPGGRVIFLAAGDPFSATTHGALRRAAESAGHRIGYLPHASILSAAPGFSGLSPYRFGRVVSVPFSTDRFRPTSFLEGIRANLAAGLHTLVLLDLDPGGRRFLRADEAARILQERDPDGERLPRDRSLVVLARIGTDRAAAWYGPRPEVEAGDFGDPMHCLIVPAPPLHFAEEEALSRLPRPPPARGGAQPVR